MDLTDSQLHALEVAVKNRVPMQMEVSKPSGLEQSWMSNVTTKSPVLESGIGGSFSGNLPPVESPFAVGRGYEPTRLAAWLSGATMPGPSATRLSHTANAAEVTGVAEGGTKGDIGPTIIENEIRPQKLAGLVSTSLEAWQDTGATARGRCRRGSRRNSPGR